MTQPYARATWQQTPFGTCNMSHHTSHSTTHITSNIQNTCHRLYSLFWFWASSSLHWIASFVQPFSFGLVRNRDLKINSHIDDSIHSKWNDAIWIAAWCCAVFQTNLYFINIRMWMKDLHVDSVHWKILYSLPNARKS